ncbi:MAG: hypothetical protein MOGMAGMI_01604 [Candidatus Omnitrophica bacterium]|nr:hypothetical protein [Candidatus Omnitrophota bacterium]
MKRVLSLLTVLSLLLMPAVAMADHGGKCNAGSQCPMSKCQDGGKSDCGESTCPIAGKILKKAEFFLDNAEGIGLSKEQIKQIKDIKHTTKKDMIFAEAGMKAFYLDVKAKLWEEKVDVDGLNKLIDDATAEMSKGAKKSVQSYAELKAVLSDDQMNKAKEIWKKNS